LLIFRMRYDFVVYWHGGAFFFSSRRRHTRCYRDWSSDVCSSDLSTREGSAGWPLRTHTRASALAALVFILAAAARSPGGARGPRSEERRVGKECRARWERARRKKKTPMKKRAPSEK